MRNIKLLIEYDGTNYHGWQRQLNAITIQEIMENMLFKITSEKTLIIASGRTDSGVHALGQVANFKIDSQMDDISFKKAFNSLLPKDIVIKDAVTVEDNFHSQHYAQSKIYRYCILNRSYPSSFDYRYSWHIRYPLNIDEMREAGAFLIGTNEFSSFRSSTCEAKAPVRTLHRLDIEKNGDKIFLWFEADGFLKQMVRNIVGTLVYVGNGRFKPQTMQRILENKNRTSAGPTAPPQGLFLIEVNLSMDKKLELKDIVLIGRTFDEYYRMFELGNINFKDEKILDVASGVSSFCSEANSKGYNVTASDKIYNFSAKEIEEKCISDLKMVMEKLPSVADLYKWEFFKNIDVLKKNRERTYKLFIEDFRKENGKRYITTEYPQTKFSDDEFTISLISHFLFMYDEHIDYEFHKKTISEIIRITTKDIRIFPIVNLKGKRSLFVDKLMRDDEFRDYKMTIKKVDYEFMRNGNEMVLIRLNYSKRLK